VIRTLDYEIELYRQPEILTSIMMTSYNIPPPMGPFSLQNLDVLGKCKASDSNLGHQTTIAMVSSFDLDNISSYPGIHTIDSMNSFTTQWSTATAHASNTTKQHSEKKHDERKFRQFVKILMRIVKEKDEGRFQNAKAVICNCEQQKRRGEIESISESLRCPLRDAVGPMFWGEAQERLKRASLYSKPKKRSSIGATLDSGIHAPAATSSVRPIEEGHFRSAAIIKSTKIFAKNAVTTANMTESGTSKKQVWMVIRVFMKYFRRNHSELYRKAHALVNECMQQHRRVKHFEESHCLSGSIQACLKKEFGLEHWRRAESFVKENLKARQENCR